jgi:mono/diheme cytochrome c family protein
MQRTAVIIAIFAGPLLAVEPDAAAGKKHLEGTAFIPAFWPRAAYDVAWKQWDLTEKPKDYAAAFADRYGLHAAPYANDGLPMGVRLAPYALIGKGIAIDCMTCHGGSIHGKSIVGLGNHTLDIQALFEEMAAASEMPVRLPFTFSHTRGTNEAGAFSVYLLGMRNDDLSLRAASPRKLGLHDDAIEDVPAWWLLKKKQTMYYVGATDARSVRSVMQFMMHPLTTPQDFARAEPKFRDILASIKAIEAPKYPFAIDPPLAAKGQALFKNNCARCHGTYGDTPTYPNAIIPLDEIGTDRKRYDNIGRKFGEAYNASWFNQEPGIPPLRETDGYQAPPLDGVWATAPYFHNGSVPTLAGVLNSQARPAVFTRRFRTGVDDYDREAVGWKLTPLPKDRQALPAYERRKIYDTTRPGHGNGGHVYGDHLTDDERRAVIEYLKTL